MVNSQPYNIGIVAALPFRVVGEFGPPEGFQRVCLDNFSAYIVAFAYFQYY